MAGLCFLLLSSSLSSAQTPNLTVSNGLRLWLKADAGVVTNGTQNISQWLDQSTNGCHASQITTTNQPLWVANALHEKPAVRFDGQNDYLSTLPLKTTGNDFSLFAVVKKEGAAIGYHPIVVRSSAFTGLTNFYRLYSSNGISSVAVDLAGTTADCRSITPLTTNAYWIVSTTRTNSIANGTQIVMDGIPDAFSSATATSSVMGTNYPVFIGGWNTARAKISLAELIIYNRCLPQPEREAVEDYLAAKYGLPDEDGNGLPDEWEIQYFGAKGQNPNGDPDGDGLVNLDEYFYGTNPIKADTDNDGTNDRIEILQGRNPLKGAIPDTGTFVNLKLFTPLE